MSLPVKDLISFFERTAITESKIEDNKDLNVIKNEEKIEETNNDPSQKKSLISSLKFVKKNTKNEEAKRSKKSGK